MQQKETLEITQAKVFEGKTRDEAYDQT